ncbi:MAG: ribosome silencing factor [Myxococcales bacterium]|nr:ribosome silencing factor [Myxococcales bacterium]
MGTTAEESNKREEVDYSDALAESVAEAAWDRKALGLRAINMRGLVSYTDVLVICSGTSDRHVAAISESIEAALKEEEIRPLGVEGRQDCRWVLMDYGDVVVHIFLDEERDVYGIDNLWAEAPDLELDQPEGLERPSFSY